MILTETADAGTYDTEYRMYPGDTFRGSIGVTGDDDYVAVYLTEGETYEISVSTSFSQEIDGRILQPDRGALTWLFDTSDYRMDTIDFNADSTGWFYIAPGFGNDTGSYEVNVTQLADPKLGTYEDFVQQLTQGYWEWREQTPAKWDLELGDDLSVDLTALNEDGKTLARLALESWSVYSGINFSEVSQNAQITFDDIPSGSFAAIDNSGSDLTHVLVNVDRTVFANGDTSIGGDGYSIFLHEIGHALGLGHAGDYNFEAFYSDAEFINDTLMISIMSYFDGSDFYQNDIWSGLGQLTPMVADILAVQSLYGVASVNAGDTVYGLNGNSGGPLEIFLASEIGEDKDPNTPVQRNSAATLFDSGGIDTLDFSAYINYFGDMVLDLRPGSTSDLADVPNGLIIMPGTVLENVIGSETNDIVTGNDANNRFEGLGGDDWLIGLGGNDVILGGLGDDTLNGGEDADELHGGDGLDLLLGRAGNDLIRGGDDNDRLFGGADHDTLSGNGGVDELSGGSGNDRLFGGNDSDTLNGENGDDTLDGGAGHDTLDGGDGIDDLRGDDGRDILLGRAGQDTIRGGEDNDRLFGGGGDDLLSGNDGADQLSGGSGNDRIFGGDDNDRLKGENGSDDLNGGDGEDLLLGHDGKDTLRGNDGNDRLYGHADDDTLSGGRGNDSIFGGTGDDRLFGGGGDDTLDGGTGADVFNGGSGADTFVFDTNDSGTTNATRDEISDFTSGEDTIDLSGIFNGTLVFVDSYSGAAGELRYNEDIGRLYAQLDGSGGSDFTLDLAGNPTLLASDLIL